MTPDDWWNIVISSDYDLDYRRRIEHRLRDYLYQGGEITNYDKSTALEMLAVLRQAYGWPTSPLRVFIQMDDLRRIKDVLKRSGADPVLKGKVDNLLRSMRNNVNKERRRTEALDPVDGWQDDDHGVRVGVSGKDVAS